MIHHFPEDFVCKEPFHGFTDPFRYAPHPAVAEAARLVISHIDSNPLLAAAFSEGKMLGVLVCSGGRYLAAFSGNVSGRSHIEGFVPPIFDLQDPAGHFKVREAEITELNHRIHAMSHSEQILTLEAAQRKANEDKEAALADYRMQMAQSRIKREEVRNETSDPHILAGLIKESQFEKAEFKRIKTAWDEKIAVAQGQIQVLHDEIAQLKASRARMSDELQDWIFRQYIVRNAYGESSSIADIFASSGLVPPGGTGECAAPKLLEYAYRNGLKPLAMGEFWYGRSPQTAVRTHGNFYPSCTSKCGPLLSYMLSGLMAEETGQWIPLVPSPTIPVPKIIYEDDDIVVAEKPSGMPSVPGLDGRFSLEEYLTSVAAHRLDMDTSGVMVLAKNPEALASLQRQFEEHTVCKTYMARISAPDQASPLEALGHEHLNATHETIHHCDDRRTTRHCEERQSTRHCEERQRRGNPLYDHACNVNGIITLPLSPDYDERPRQKVDFQQGKPAHTDYEVVQVNPDGTADLLLYPHTGRTHQLRVHCAHSLGLGRPILGDLLYGGWSVNLDSNQAANRLHLHALSITFKHPVTGEELTFTSRELCY